MATTNNRERHKVWISSICTDPESPDSDLVLIYAYTPVGQGLCSSLFKRMGLSRHFQLWVFTVRETTQLRINMA